MQLEMYPPDGSKILRHLVCSIKCNKLILALNLCFLTWALLQVCDQLSVPLSVVPLTNQYWERVVSHCVQEIKNGRTPNPDVLCNSRVKFGAFFEYLSKHDSGFDRVASGHYARVKRVLIDEDSPSEPRDHVETHCRDVSLCLTPDAVKDQTYFLANLSQDQLQKVLFPLGTLTKSEVRRLAKTANLPTMQRKDSQGICFLGKVKFNEFIKVMFIAINVLFNVTRSKVTGFICNTTICSSMNKWPSSGMT